MFSSYAGHSRDIRQSKNAKEEEEKGIVDIFVFNIIISFVFFVCFNLKIEFQDDFFRIIFSFTILNCYFIDLICWTISRCLWFKS